MTYDPREKFCPPLKPLTPPTPPQPPKPVAPAIEEPDAEQYGDGMAYHFRPEDFAQ